MPSYVVYVKTKLVHLSHDKISKFPVFENLDNQSEEQTHLSTITFEANMMLHEIREFFIRHTIDFSDIFYRLEDYNTHTIFLGEECKGYAVKHLQNDPDTLDLHTATDNRMIVHTWLNAEGLAALCVLKEIRYFAIFEGVYYKSGMSYKIKD